MRSQFCDVQAIFNLKKVKLPVHIFLKKLFVFFILLTTNNDFIWREKKSIYCLEANNQGDSHRNPATDRKQLSGPKGSGKCTLTFLTAILMCGHTLCSGLWGCLMLDAGRVGKQENTRLSKQRGIWHLRMPYATLSASISLQHLPQKEGSSWWRWNAG